ncbi:response regulator [Labrys sp. LIt4]|uniref:response regulator n=1 Tax=Labrys sp. LIt4 TaxID=2821355 RepID=UPI001ADF4909|nr:response regulator [Labrys sp. LIt4]MBP0583389.1 response regulator [Labrys sp. LIt4]
MQSNQPRPAVLVIEDEVFARIVIADFLADRHLEVLEAENADKALQILEQRQDVKVIFTDINMPGKLNGIELARIVRTRWPRVHVLVTTGAPQKERIPAGSHFVSKPYDQAQLADRIHLLAKAD